jgi:(4S)-4-hydroxy-5-phosphonooxypentane-2,3-dione isomerase
MNCRVLAASLLCALMLASPALAETAAKPAYVVVVDYKADAKNFDALKTLVDSVAKASIAEPGCRRFDVIQPAASPNHLLLYEIFDDAAAFQAHSAAPHFKRFGADTAKIGATRTATPGSMLISLKNPEQ